MSYGRWSLIGVALLLLWLALLAPAALLARVAAAGGMELQGVSGSLWSGKAKSARLQLASVRGQRQVFDLGEVTWTLHPLALLGLQACATVGGDLKQQQFQGQVCKSMVGNLELSDVRIHLPASYTRLFAPVDASGQLLLAIDEARLQGQQLVALSGSGRVENFSLLIDKDWQRFGNLDLQLSQAADAGLHYNLANEDHSIELSGAAPQVTLGLAGPEMQLTSSLKLSESYSLQWGNALALLGFEERDGAYVIETKLP